MNFEQYMKMVEDTHSSHLKGVLNEIEYINAYNEILDTVLDSDTISELEKRELVGIIKTKIGLIPVVENMKRETKNQEIQAKEEAFIEAKKRFKSLSLFQKVKSNIKGRGPDQLRRSLGTIEEINGLYRR